MTESIKKKFTEPTAELILFEFHDVLKTSIPLPFDFLTDEDTGEMVEE